MKKEKIYCSISIILITSLLALTACSPQTIADGIAVMTGKKQVSNDPGPYAQQDDAFQTLIYDEDFSDGGYYYARLPDRTRKAYQLIYNCLKNNQPTVEILNTYDAEINQAYKSVIFEHPELFYIDGFQLEKHASDPSECIFRPNYIQDASQQAYSREKIRLYTEDLMASLDQTSDYTRLKGIYDYVVTHTEYNITGTNLSNICSVTNTGQAVCDGYAKAVMYFCNQVGIECIVVPGYIRSSGTAHLWNAVKLENDWYFVDATWGDEDFENAQKAPEVRYDYLCVSEEQLVGTHQFEAFVDPPVCESTRFNYYAQAGKMITVCNKEQLSAVFSGADSMTSVTFACANRTVYQQVEDYLIGRRHAFEYMPKQGTGIGYLTNPNIRSFTFWIRGAPDQ